MSTRDDPRISICPIYQDNRAAFLVVFAFSEVEIRGPSQSSMTAGYWQVLLDIKLLGVSECPMLRDRTLIKNDL